MLSLFKFILSVTPHFSCNFYLLSLFHFFVGTMHNPKLLGLILMFYMPNTNISYFHNIFKRLFYKTIIIMCSLLLSLFVIIYISCCLSIKKLHVSINLKIIVIEIHKFIVHNNLLFDHIVKFITYIKKIVNIIYELLLDI